MKMNPPPDTDKVSLAGNNSCYLATAANMLAGAGYGDGASVQARATDIYGDLTGHFGIANGGWTDTALTWWLNSTNNTWPNNPYTLVTVYGNKTKTPWTNTNGAQFVGNELRVCHFVGLSISWPRTSATGSPDGGHAITSWGDNLGSGTLTVNPPNVALTDSDQDTGGDVQRYDYDSYTNPNPAGLDEGNGWYLNYSANHPFIKHIVTLAPTDDINDNKLTQRVLGSFKITQSSEIAATDLHYWVGTDVDILTYRTWTSWPSGAPTIAEDQPRRGIQVDWDFHERPVPHGTEVTINTEFVVPAWNAIGYRDVHFTYPDGDAGRRLAPFAWRIETPRLERAEAIRDVTGGYVVGAFDLVRLDDQSLVGRYRFVHQYSFNQSPEQHRLLLDGAPGLAVRDLRVGHSYGMPDVDSLWRYEAWMTRAPEVVRLGEEAAEVRIDWRGRLPYPAGEDVTRGRRDLAPNRRPQ